MSLHTDQHLALFDTLSTLRRPRLLMQTARHGLREYERSRDLRRIMRLPAAPAPGVACVRQLLALEAEIEATRRRQSTDPGAPWRPARHVEVLIALLAESALLLRPVRALPQPAEA